MIRFTLKVAGMLVLNQEDGRIVLFSGRDLYSYASRALAPIEVIAFHGDYDEKVHITSEESINCITSKVENVAEILKQWLQDNGFDGLVNPEEECGCSLDELCLCEADPSECKPAYWLKCVECADREKCEYFAEAHGGCFSTERKK